MCPAPSESRLTQDYQVGDVGYLTHWVMNPSPKYKVAMMLMLDETEIAKYTFKTELYTYEYQIMQDS